MEVYLKLLPKGKYAAKGYYYRLSCRQLQFDIQLLTKTARNYITLSEEPMTCIAISGAIHKGAGNCQQRVAISQYRDRVPPSRLEDFDRLMQIWEDYHLNNLTAGTLRQEEALGEWKKAHQYNYNAACEYLEKLNLLTDNGYRYGSGWLCKPIPPEDVMFIQALLEKWKEND